MSRRSSVAPGVFFKNLATFARHPLIGKKLLALQAEKMFFNQLHPGHKGGVAGKIRQVSIRITDMCNLRCVMCGQWGDTGFLHDKDLKALKAREVPPERYKEMLDDLVKHGHKPVLYLWGGEPLMYDGSIDIMLRAKQLGLPSAIATNGSKVAGVAEELTDIPLFLLQVSIDGPSAEIHNAIRRGVGGMDSFARIEDSLDTVRELRKRKKNDLPLIASLTTVSKDNSPYLVDIYEHFKDKVDMFVFYPAWWIDKERAVLHEQDFSRRFGFKPELHRGWIGGWKPQDFEALNKELEELLRRSSRLSSPPVALIPNITGVDNLKRYYTDHAARFGFTQCISIYQAVEIDSNGDLSPCRDYHDYIVGNIKDKTITELWNNERYVGFRRSLSSEGLMPACSRCCGLMGY